MRVCRDSHRVEEVVKGQLERSLQGGIALEVKESGQLLDLYIKTHIISGWDDC